MQKTDSTNVRRYALMSIAVMAGFAIATTPLTGCIIPDEPIIKACPSEAASDVQCDSEGEVTYTLQEVFQADKLLFVKAHMQWLPCGATPGEHSRYYQIDPDGDPPDGGAHDGGAPDSGAPDGGAPQGPTTKVINLLPNDAVAISGLTGDSIEIAIKDTDLLVRLLRKTNTSVSSSTLAIGAVVDNTTGLDTGPIEIDVVCQN
jgi:hypothetical protein